LEFLLSRGANMEEVDKEGTTPLMIACSLGRLDNAKYIVETLRNLGNGVAVSKMGVGGVDRPQKNSWRSLHLAVAEGRLEIVKFLLEVGAQAESQLSTNFDKMTPLMLAAANGDLVNLQFLLN
jgi:ankyrin repeat protein